MGNAEYPEVGTTAPLSVQVKRPSLSLQVSLPAVLSSISGISYSTKPFSRTENLRSFEGCGLSKLDIFLASLDLVYQDPEEGLESFHLQVHRELGQAGLELPYILNSRRRRSDYTARSGGYSVHTYPLERQLF